MSLPRSRAVKAAALVCGALLLYLYFSSPGKLVVSPAGEIKSIVNMTRAAIQGRTFWKNQLEEANRSLRWKRGEPARAAEARRVVENTRRETKQLMEDMYRQYPGTRPSTASQQAAALRELADQIEQTEMERMLEQSHLQHIAELERTLPLLQARAR